MKTLSLNMKKIAKAFVGGLIISMILISLLPSLFLKDDALWTYQSNTGRVDVAFAGDVQHGYLEVRGDNVRAYKPKWLLDNRHNQGTSISFPVSYLKRTYEITLEPQGSTREVSLVMNFRGQDIRIENQRKPAYVRFENIRINGRIIAEEQMVWHDEPFRHDVKNISTNSFITLSFEIQKPISFADISSNEVMGLFVVVSMFSFFLVPFRRLINRDNERGLLQVISEGYMHIDVVYRRSFWIIFGVLCFAFGFHTIQFMWGNHDWSFLTYPLHLDFSLWMGRYALHWFKVFFLKGVYLPVIYDILSFFFLALSAVLLCVYWKLNKRIIYFVLCGLILTVQPFTLSLTYFVHMIPETFIGVTFILTALILSERLAFEKISPLRKGILTVLAIVLINLSLATYPVLINTIAVVFIGRLLVQSLGWDGSWTHFKSCFAPFALSAFNIAIGTVSYKIVVSQFFQIVTDSSNTQTLPLSKLPERLMVLSEQALRQLYEYNYPFISQGVLWVFLAFTLLIVLHICLTGNIRQKLLRISLLFCSLYATQAAMMIANKHLIEGRIELFGLVPFETLIAVLVFTELKKLQNLSIFAATGVVWVSIINDLDCLRVWKFGFDAERMLWNRVLTRLETRKEFDVNKKYKVIQVGGSYMLQPRFYTYPVWTYENSYVDILFASYEASWDLFHAYEFYYPVPFRAKENYRPEMKNSKYKDQLKRLYEAGILNKARAWPHENGLIVWRDVILFITDAKALENCKKQLAKEFPRQPQNTP